MSRRAVVLGAGVIGLTTALRLRETGWDVTIVAERLPLETTSAVAAALWLPFKAFPPDRVLAWSRLSLTAFTELAENPATGVVIRAGMEIWRQPVADPWWRSAVPQFERCRAEQLPAGFCAGYHIVVPVIDMPVYLIYLFERCKAAGVQWVQRRLRSRAEAEALGSPLINCTGLGAAALLPDESMQPLRGQIVRVANPGLTQFLLDEDAPGGPAYIVPRTHDCILGGTVEEGVWDLTPDPGVAEAIRARCIALEPRLEAAAILEHKVGLRPGRPSVRLEREVAPSGAVWIHNYGHGGAGVTLSWGCADEVLHLLA
jgi:D-amino-acid oxidase